MIDVILNYPSQVTGQTATQEMPLEMLNNLLDLAEQEIQGRLTLHADWHRPPDYLEEALQQITRRALNFKACFYSDLSVPWIQKVLRAGGSITLSAQKLATSSLQEMGALFDKHPLEPTMSLEIFVPLPHPDFSPIDFDPMIDAGLPIKSVLLAVGWENFFSGPLPIKANHHDIWAQNIEAAVNAYTDAKLTTRFACGLPLCIFSTKQLGRLAKRNLKFPISHCAPDLMVTPDGVMRSCQRLNLPKPQTADTAHPLGDTTQAIDQWLKPFRSLCPLADQLVCRSAVCGACGCGCQATSMAEWKNSG